VAYQTRQVGVQATSRSDPIGCAYSGSEDAPLSD
jgi:hypothetical protein